MEKLGATDRTQAVAIAVRRGFMHFEDTTHLSQLDNSSPHRDCNCLSTIASAKFLHDVFDVNLDSLFGDEESFCDVAIPVTAPDMFQDIDLSVGESFVAEMLGQVGCDFRRNPFFTSVNLPNDLDEFLRRHVL